MDYFKWLIAGLIGAAVGGVVWVVVGHFGNLQVGYIAWGVGLLAGLGVRKVSLGATGPGPGAAALIAAVFVIALSKYVVISLRVDQQLEQFLVQNAQRPSEEDQIATVADEIVEEFEQQNQPIVWPAGDGNDEIVTAADYPAEIWQTAKDRWQKMSDEEKRRRAEERARVMAQMIQAMAPKFKEQAFLGSFGGYDLLWFGLAAMTAYRVGHGGHDSPGQEGEPAPPSGDPDHPPAEAES